MKRLVYLLLAASFACSGHQKTDKDKYVVKTTKKSDGKIVFSSNRNGNFDIYTMLPDGSGVKQLTRDLARDAWPKWSPDGKKIIFCSERYGKNQIMIMNADGSNLRNISSNNENELDPVISPDGKKVAFINKATGSYQLNMMNIDGTNRRRLTSSGPFCGRPDWSPDSKTLVYLSSENGFFEIYKIKTNGTGKKKLTNLRTEAGSPSWSKNGYDILFHGHENNVDYLFKMSANGSRKQKIKNVGESDFIARWNGSSSKIVFTSKRSGDEEIYTYNLQTKEEKRITFSTGIDRMADWFTPADSVKLPSSFDPAIPDDYRIAFVSYRSGTGDVYLIKPDGTEIKRLTDSDDNNSFPRDIGNNIISFRRSDADDQRIYSNYQLNLNNNEVTPYNPTPIDSGAYGEVMSPNGRYISYSKENNNRNDLYIFDKELNKHTKITSNQRDSIDQQAEHIWSSDSKKIAFLGGPDWFNQYIRIFDIETGELKNITKRGYMCAGITWLNTNDAIIANFKIRNKTTYELWSVKVSDGAMTQLTDHPGRGSVHPKISPDGNWVVFESGRDGDDGELYLMRPDGRNQIRITFNPSYEGRPEWVVID